MHYTYFFFTADARINHVGMTAKPYSNWSLSSKS